MPDRTAAPPHLRARDKQTSNDDRGRDAKRPSEIPAKGWKDIALRTWREVNADNIGLVSAGMTFYALMAIFPALVSFVSIYGLATRPLDAAQDFRDFSANLPGPMRGFVGEQMVRLAATPDTALSASLVFSLLLSLWSANGAAKAMFTGLNIAYEENEKRGFLHLNLVTLGFTIGLLALSIIAALLLVAVPLADARGALPNVLNWARWPMQWFGLAFALALLYRYGPSREKPRWRWVSWGSALAASLWLLASAAVSFYFSQFGNLDRTYGPLAAAIGFMIWAYWSFYIVLVGAELNSEIEHQTAEDSTTGKPAPIGARGAKMADSIGDAQS